MMASEIDEKGMIFFVSVENANQKLKVIFMAFCIFVIQVFLKSRISGTDHWL